MFGVRHNTALTYIVKINHSGVIVVSNVCVYASCVSFWFFLWSFELYDTGSKDEAFFDSKGWLDSDCEDDFYSVNGGKEAF